MPAKKLIIFGTGIISQCVTPYFERSDYEIISYCCDALFLTKPSFNDRPVIDVDDLLTSFNSDDVDIFIALGYHKMNSFRKSKFTFFREKGFNLASYVHPFISSTVTVGQNSFLPDQVVVQPHTTIGSNCFVWPGATVGHHSAIQDHCWVTSGATLGGLVQLGDESFVGLGSTICDSVVVGARSLVGAGTLITKDAPEESVFVAEQTQKHRLNTTQFSKITSFFDS